jgi:hypothetical protein
MTHREDVAVDRPASNHFLMYIPALAAYQFREIFS